MVEIKPGKEKRETQSTHGRNGSTHHFSRKLLNFIVFFACSSSGIWGFRKWRWKLTSSIPVEPVFSQELKYTTNFNNGFRYGANRRKREIATKPKFSITQPISNNFTIQDLLYNLQSVIYNIPITI